NHFSSKGSDEPLTGRWQPPARPTESQRHAQARVVHDFVADVLDVQPSAAIAVVGDLNDFEFSRTIDLLVGSDHRPTLYDLPRELPGRERYGYVYQGNSQVLDHILLSPGARRWRPSYDIVHVNAEFADQDSDHDPQIVRLAVR
ncbi:MAG TPA: endonuclease/exonuclease/phosphatase family protein, partial [Actinopolymorphaceae bacterium]